MQQLSKHKPSVMSDGGAYRRQARPSPAPAAAANLNPGYVSFRVLCPCFNVGAVIGKAGMFVKLIRRDTGASVRAADTPPGVAETVFTVVGLGSATMDIPLSPEAETAEGSPAQAALMRVFDRILESGCGAAAEGGEAQCRMLAPGAHVGALIGRAGKRIEKMKMDTGAWIQVLSETNFQSFPCYIGEIVEITGDPLAVKKALLAVSSCLQESFLLDLAEVLPRNVFMPPTKEAAFPRMEACYPCDEQQLLQQEVKFRLLCDNDMIDDLIGENGTGLTDLESETRASITCGDIDADCEERVVTISALEHSELKDSPTQIAVIHVFCRYIEARITKEKNKKINSGPISARLLILPSEVGCLMGKGGAIISELRIVTGTDIKVIRGRKVPKCAIGNGELLQIDGEFQNVKVALLHVTARLRENIFSPGPKNRKVMSYSSNTSYSTGSAFPSQTGLIHEMSHLRLSEADKGTKMQWVVKQVNSTSSVYDNSDFDAKSSQSLPVLCSESTAETSLEIEVSTHLVGSVRGENGSNLSRVNLISGAEVVVRDQVDGRVSLIVLRGTQDQIELAQSLVQAFILAAQNSATSNSNSNSNNIDHS